MIENRFGNKEQVIHHDPIEGFMSKVIHLENNVNHIASDYN